MKNPFDLPANSPAGSPKRRLRFALPVLLAGWVFGLGALPAQASSPPGKNQGPSLSPFRWHQQGRAWLEEGAARLTELEFVQMLTSILNGSPMGPGDGWFRPGQSRYGWGWLARHYD